MVPKSDPALRRLIIGRKKSIRVLSKERSHLLNKGLRQNHIFRHPGILRFCSPPGDILLPDRRDHGKQRADSWALRYSCGARNRFGPGGGRGGYGGRCGAFSPRESRKRQQAVRADHSRKKLRAEILPRLPVLGCLFHLSTFRWSFGVNSIFLAPGVPSLIHLKIKPLSKGA